MSFIFVNVLFLESSVKQMYPRCQPNYERACPSAGDDAEIDIPAYISQFETKGFIVHLSFTLRP